MPLGLHRLLADAANASRINAYEATIATTAVAEGADVYVRVPAFDGGEQLFGPCPWQSRGLTFPTSGDRALVVLDEKDEPWIVLWWPYG